MQAKDAELREILASRNDMVWQFLCIFSKLETANVIQCRKLIFLTCDQRKGGNMVRRKCLHIFVGGGGVFILYACRRKN